MTGNPLPGDEAFAELVDAIGEEAAKALALHYGGTKLYVPLTVGEHHPIRAIVGEEAAERLVEWAGGGSVSIPKQAARRARVRDLHQKGALTIQRIAMETAYSERHVYRLIEAERDDRQLGLFGTD
ncbi:MAG: hypothetical protein V2I27_03665 [Erythrobacter sp.]|jgi:hypothetical protein|nr:hypothetical protein [Erythrobacter sp.]